MSNSDALGIIVAIDLSGASVLWSVKKPKCFGLGDTQKAENRKIR